MCLKKIKEKFKSIIKDFKDFDEYITNYSICDNVDAEIAIHNYELYQNDLKLRQKELIEKWNKKIIEASSNGEKFLMTNKFITDNDKDKILWALDDAGCVMNFSPNATLQYFQQYYENKGFKVVKIVYQANNICCLKIIWISSDKIQNKV